MSKIPQVGFLSLLKGTDVVLAKNGRIVELNTDSFGFKVGKFLANLIVKVPMLASLRGSVEVAHLLPPKIVIIGDGYLVYELSHHDVRLSNRPYIVTGADRSIGAEALIVSEGENWSEIHKTLEPFFTKRGIDTRFGQVIGEEVDRILMSLPERNVLPVQDFADRLARSVIFRVVTGRHLDDKGGLESARDWTEGKFVINGHIDENLLAPGSIARALRNQQLESGKSDSWLLDQLTNLLSNGEVTSRLVLAKAIRELSISRDFQNNFRMGGSTQSRESFINEVLRQRTVPPFAVSREALEDFQLGPYPIKKGSWLIIYTWSVHENPEDWSLTDQTFAPDAFRDEPVRTSSLRFCPFGFGRRICIGRHLATLETETVLRRLVELYELELETEDRILLKSRQ